MALMKNETCEACGHLAPLLYVSANLSLCAICDDEYRQDQEWLDYQAAKDLPYDENENDYNSEW